jgi:hypothetical protein
MSIAQSLLLENTLSRHQLSAILQRNAKSIKVADLDAFLVFHPELTTKVRPRRVIVDFYAKGAPNVCLIVENMDTYHYLKELLPLDWMLVCGFGQRITKGGVFEFEIADLHASVDTHYQVIEHCSAFWVDQTTIKLYWGDLDQNGESIFQSLKGQLPKLKKWLPVYSEMNSISDSLGGNIDVNQEAILVNASMFDVV